MREEADMGERRALVVMTRVPEPGKTKTRMMPDLTPSQCAEFHACMLRDISETCVAVAKRGVEVFVAFAPEGAREEVGAYFDVEAGYFPQRGATLGERLGNAIGEVLSRGCSRVAVIGADSPEVGGRDVVRALDALDRCDVALGPADDGGYYLIAMSALHPEAFALDSFGHEGVFAETVSCLERAGLTFEPLRCVADIDRRHDAEGLLARAADDENVARLRSVRYLRGIGW